MGHWLTDGKTKIGWDMFPDRKKPVICITECGSHETIAYGSFNSEESAHAFMDRLAELVKAEKVEA